ncbi:Proteasome subunit beta type-6, partial [Temnothorax longispinosus]
DSSCNQPIKRIAKMAYVNNILQPHAVNVSEYMIPDWLNSEQSTGTSIMACEFNGGVVIGADSRGTTGAYVSNRFADKLTRVTDYIYCCRSGSAADTQAIADIVAYHLGLHQMELGMQPLVETAANVFREICYNYRDSLMAGILVAGWDKQKGGQVYSIPIGGMCVRQPISIGGSGSTYVYGYVDAQYKPNMSKNECLKLVENTLALAMARDGSSGGVIRTGVITEKGIERKVILDCHNDTIMMRVIAVRRSGLFLRFRHSSRDLYQGSRLLASAIDSRRVPVILVSYRFERKPIRPNYLRIINKGTLNDLDLAKWAPEMPTVQEIIKSMQNFGMPDYTIFAAMLVMCGIVGIYFGFVKKSSGEDEYLVGGRNMSTFPVSLSLLASFISEYVEKNLSIELIRPPSEI